MMRKINDPEYRVPYIIGQNPKFYTKQYWKKLQRDERKKITIPKEFK